MADYGAFRDLQRHRMLTVEWQPLGTELGYEVPELVEAAGLRRPGTSNRWNARRACTTRSPRHFPEQSAYAVALAFNVRFVLQLSAREAMHVLELRSSPQGHPDLPADRPRDAPPHRRTRPGHRAIADSMSFVDHSETDLGRLEAEQRSEDKRSGNSATSL